MSFGVTIIVVGSAVAAVALCVLGACIRANGRPVTIGPEYADMGVPVSQRRVQLAAPEQPPTRTWQCTVREKVDGHWVRRGVLEFVWPAWTGAEVQAELHRRIEARQPDGEYRVDVARALQSAA